MLPQYYYYYTCLTAGTTQVSRYQKSKTNQDFTEARDSEWQWHQQGHMQVCTSRSRQITTPAPHHSVFLQAGCPSCRPTNSVRALKAKVSHDNFDNKQSMMMTMMTCKSFRDLVVRRYRVQILENMEP